MRKQTKMADQEAQNRQMAELAKEKATQAEARSVFVFFSNLLITYENGNSTD